MQNKGQLSVSQLLPTLLRRVGLSHTLELEIQAGNNYKIQTYLHKYLSFKPPFDITVDTTCQTPQLEYLLCTSHSLPTALLSPPILNILQTT